MDQSSFAPGLYIVATPLGNLKDITLRALDLLQAVDLILCEDTRVSRKLLSHYGISVPLETFHDYNENQKIPDLLQRLYQGQRLALISDAGTPLISDPGYKLIQAVIAKGFMVTSLPGPSALINALVLAGLPCHQFFFAGFLPSKRVARLKELEILKTIPGTLIFYEAPQRLLQTLEDLLQLYSERDIVVLREMTKRFEDIIRGTVSSVRQHFCDNPVRGEIVLCISPPRNDQDQWNEAKIEEMLLMAFKKLSLKEAVEEISSLSSISKKIIYQKALKIRDQSDVFLP